MYHPTTRLLTILEVLQSHAQLSGEELARRLEVEPRSVRRYIQMLQEMGIPIEGTHGLGGGYRLRPGYTLPPLFFTEEEATALVLGLQGTPWMELSLSSVVVEGTLAKISRVLPQGGRELLQTILSHTILLSHEPEMRPEATLLVEVSEAVHNRCCITMDYCSSHDEVTRRDIEPYGLVGWRGHWYVVAYCCLRQEYRLFRLDRMRNVHRLSRTFVRAEAFDCSAYVIKHLATNPALWQIEVEFQANLFLVQHKIPAPYDRLVVTPTGMLYQSHHNDLAASRAT
jgi:predicted DNA-binding transcriptional regulator YafY